MRRRRMLAVASGLMGSATAGCVGRGGDGRDDSTGVPDRVGTPEPGAPTMVDGVELPVPRSELRHPLPADYIPAIVEPEFGDDWSGLDGDGEETRLPSDAPVMGVERDGGARAYPLRVLGHHEVVNDDLGGPIAVTYCVICGSGLVLDRRVDGVATRFGVSGRLWRSDLVMYDVATESLWSQLLATAIRGPRTGEQLDVVPASLTTWGGWRDEHPDTDVLLPPPHSGTLGPYDRSFDYFSPKYSYGEERQLVGWDSHDGELHPKTMVVGVEHDGVVRAYPFPVVVEADVVNDTVGDLPVVVAVAPDGTLVAYDRRVGDRTRAFEAAGDAHLQAGGSRWQRTTGRAVDGPFEGDVLTRANDQPPMFWKGWTNFNPETDVYGTDL